MNLFPKSKGGALAFEWIYFLVFLFAIGVLYIMLNQILTNYIYPIPGNIMSDSDPHKADVINDNSTWMQYWRFTPILVFILFLIWIVIRSTLQNSQSGDYGL